MSETNGKYAPLPGKIPGVAINLGGHEFVLAPLGLRLMREFKERGNAAMADGNALTDDEGVAFNVDMIFESLRRNYPELTREEVESLLDATNMNEAVKLVLDQTGLKRVTVGEIQPVK